MRLVYTQSALRDLEEIFDYQRREWPSIMPRFEARLSAIERRIIKHPLSAQEVLGRPGVRVAAFLTHPYRLFYQVRDDIIEVLHIRHAARRDWRTQALDNGGN